MVTLDALRRLGKQSIRVTDIVSQFWCELQMELRKSAKFKPVVSEEMKQGRAIHSEIEAKMNHFEVPLHPQSYADSLYKSLYSGTVAMDSLMKTGSAREVQVYGNLNGFKLTGKIDQLSLEGGEVIIQEDKTTSKDTQPPQSQIQMNLIQLQLYKVMLERAISGEYTVENFKREYSTFTLSITSDFAKELDALGVKKWDQTIDSAAASFFTQMRKLGKISDRLRLCYMNQEMARTIGQYEFKFDQASIDRTLAEALPYWKGERPARPVPREENWKCNYCEFFGKECKVWWTESQKKLG